MDHEAFEKVVSDWLDEPGNEALRRQIDAALASDSSLSATLSASLRLDAVLKREPAALARVNWNSLTRHISGQTEADPASVAVSLDALLKALPDVQDRVDWARFRHKLTARLNQESIFRPNYSRRLTIRVFSGVLATAAMLLIVLWVSRYPTDSAEFGAIEAADRGTAALSVTGPGYALGGAAVSQLAVAAPDDFDSFDDDSGEFSGRSIAAAEEVYMMISPQPHEPAFGAAGLFGS